LGERPTWLETVGVLTTLASFVGLSVAGSREGVHFHRNKWVGFLVVGTLLGAVSSLYDKYLLGRAHFSVPTVQAWFSVYLLVLFTPFAIGWKRRWWPRKEFHWRWSIPFIAFSLLVADYIYFSALRDPHSLGRDGDEPAPRQHAGGLCRRPFAFRRAKRMAKLPAVIGILTGHPADRAGMKRAALPPPDRLRFWSIVYFDDMRTNPCLEPLNLEVGMGIVFKLPSPMTLEYVSQLPRTRLVRYCTLLVTPV
jgi:hypothetical protein